MHRIIASTYRRVVSLHRAVSVPALYTMTSYSQSLTRNSNAGRSEYGASHSDYFGSSLMICSLLAVLVGNRTTTAVSSCDGEASDRSDDDDDAVSMVARRARSNGSIMLSRNFVADAIEVVAPSVVNIVCLVDGYMGVPMGASSGSGFIISTDGFIVTNAHVVSASSTGKVLVTMHDGKKRKGYVHSMDMNSDIALVKLKNDDAKVGRAHEPLSPVTFGQSSALRGGEFVIALGSPLQLQNSASLGIVSATARHASELGLANNRSEYIQTDAAINMGNSGGPLVNLDGEVIGISTMKVKESSGISFAIPVDVATVVIKQLMAHKRVIRPFVGLKMANYVPNSGSNARGDSGGKGWFPNFGQQSGGGNGAPSRRNRRRDPNEMLDAQTVEVMVLDVVKDSPAHRCGIRSGDIIQRVNGKLVTGVRDVLNTIGLEVGKTLEFEIRRETGEVTTVFLTTAPER